jgi:RHS repeat-associated protein
VTAQDKDKFATYYRDASGLDYAQNRYYANTLGRFTSPDPYKASGGPADPQSWNKYSYVQGDPINYSDGSGLLAGKVVCDAQFSAAYCSEFDFLADGGGYKGGDEFNCDSGVAPFVSTSADCALYRDRIALLFGPPPKQIPCEINGSIIDAFITSTPIFGDRSLKKPLQGTGQAFIDAALKYDVNPAVLVAIGFRESHWGYDTRNGGSNNAFGLLNSNGLLRYSSWEAGVSGAAKTVESAYGRGNRSVADLYSGLPGAYCTHGPCPGAIDSLEKMVRSLKEDPDYLGFDCTMVNGVVVKKQ